MSFRAVIVSGALLVSPGVATIEVERITSNYPISSGNLDPFNHVAKEEESFELGGHEADLVDSNQVNIFQENMRVSQRTLLVGSFAVHRITDKTRIRQPYSRGNRRIVNRPMSRRGLHRQSI